MSNRMKWLVCFLVLPLLVRGTAVSAQNQNAGIPTNPPLGTATLHLIVEDRFLVFLNQFPTDMQRHADGKRVFELTMLPPGKSELRIEVCDVDVAETLVTQKTIYVSPGQTYHEDLRSDHLVSTPTDSGPVDVNTSGASQSVVQNGVVNTILLPAPGTTLPGPTTHNQIDQILQQNGEMRQFVESMNGQLGNLNRRLEEMGTKYDALLTHLQSKPFPDAQKFDEIAKRFEAAANVLLNSHGIVGAPVRDYSLTSSKLIETTVGYNGRGQLSLLSLFDATVPDNIVLKDNNPWNAKEISVSAELSLAIAAVTKSGEKLVLDFGSPLSISFTTGSPPQVPLSFGNAATGNLRAWLEAAIKENPNRTKPLVQDDKITSFKILGKLTRGLSSGVTVKPLEIKLRDPR